ncbi:MULTISPECIES: hypothetical protein [unclassified Moorena]|uniref:hypothetical protein n=1 Tax=unclassified Moorena TaxID=2683338 RepID=UPI0013FE6E10|nr:MULTISPECIES: hypothetical protein [unclassified Moorena]NEO11320.1 hypothetical protein [Moorena sp. SIO3E8]NEP97872.1 hypothetical protein [Moorena sp. SIO3F7]
MIELFSYPCSGCGSEDVSPHHRYSTQNHGFRTIYHCRECDIYFSETIAAATGGSDHSPESVIRDS